MLQKAVIIDLDGTLACSQHVDGFRKPTGGTDWPAWIAATAYATVNEWCLEIVKAFHAQGYTIIFLTARSDAYNGREITTNWLNMQLATANISDYKLIMRPADDYRKDFIIKTELFYTQVLPYYEVLFAVDDKREVVDMWRNLGVTALHCADY